ncbi:PepSY-associated TM helix domain-containing protein [Streptomyces sp. NPDC004749]
MPTEIRVAESSTLDGPAPPRPSASAGPPTGGAWVVLRPLLLRLHFYAGVLVAPFLLVAAVTGILYAGSLQAEKIVYDHELRVPVGSHRLPLEKQVAAARAAYPEGTIDAIRPGAGPGTTTRVLLDVPGLKESHRLAVFVDPYRGEARGALDVYGNSGALPLRTWIDGLHRDLHLGDAGRLYSELAASWLWVVALGGVLLWLGRRRNVRRTRRTLLPETGAKGRRRTLSWHGAVGLWAAAGFCFLSATGLTWSQYAGQNITDLRAALSWETPAVSTEPAHHGAGPDATEGADAPGGAGSAHGAHQDGAGEDDGDGAVSGAGPHGAGAGDVGVDRVLRAAREEGLSDPVEIRFPTGPGLPYSVKQIKNSRPEKHDAVAVAPATGEVTEVIRFDDWPLAAKLSRWGIDAHMGLLFGVANQIVLVALMTALILVISLGYRMWWRRRPTRPAPGERDRRAWGRPPVRGAWRRVPGRILAPLTLLAAVLGYYVPLLGISLLLFLALDLALAAYARRRALATGDVR